MRQLYHSHGWTEEGKKLRQRALDERLCVNCDAPLTGRKIYYCSGFCSLKAYNNATWWKVDDWRKLRRQALERDGYRCVKCGITEKEMECRFKEDPYHQPWPSLEVDHIVEIAIGGPEFALDNLQTLCPSCHKKKTNKFLSARFSLPQ